VFAYVCQSNVLTRVKAMQERIGMPTNDYKSTTWTSGGHEITVKTAKEGNETDEQWQARHDQKVREIQTVAPPD
jgi:hypothetical protein